MRTRAIMIVTVLVCATVLAAVILYDAAHRYDLVAVGAGGSSQDNGPIAVWLVDHKTGDVWTSDSASAVLIPVHLLTQEEMHGTKPK